MIRFALVVAQSRLAPGISMPSGDTTPSRKFVLTR